MCAIDEEMMQGEEELDMDSVDGGAADVTSALPWDLEHVPYEFTRITKEESIRRSLEFYEQIKTRRTIRFFSSDPVPVEVIHNIIKAAGKILRFINDILVDLMSMRFCRIHSVFRLNKPGTICIMSES